MKETVWQRLGWWLRRVWPHKCWRHATDGGCYAGPEGAADYVYCGRCGRDLVDYIYY